MINHFRTLLLNVNGSVPMLNFLAEEIVDPGFRALKLSTAITQVRRVLFGTEPDRHMLNIRARQLLALVHATPLIQHVTEFDERITYNFASNQLLQPDTWLPKVQKITGNSTLTVLGDPEPPDYSGKIHYRYNVMVASDGFVTVEQITAPFQKVDFGFEPNERIPLPGSNCDARLATTEEGQEFLVDIYSRPQADLATLCDDLAKLGEVTLNSIFGIVDQEPWRTFRALFFRNKELPLRLSSIVCAAVYRCEEIRRG